MNKKTPALIPAGRRRFALAACMAAATLAAASPSSQCIDRFGRRHGLGCSMRGDRITLAGRVQSMELTGNSRRAFCNGTLIWLNFPVLSAHRGWNISDIDAQATLLPLLAPQNHLRGAGHALVVLDAGHGGHDKGAVSPRRVEEKRVTLYLARRVRDILLQNGVRVRMTREDDRYITLEDRCRMAERWRADLFVSIHMNSAASPAARGIETHILPPAGAPTTADARVTEGDRRGFPANRHDAANMYLGFALQRNMLSATQAEDRGVRRSRFYVLRNIHCPAALVEGGFISNPGEEHLIIQKAYRDKLAEGIARGILEYLAAVRHAHHDRR